MSTAAQNIARPRSGFYYGWTIVGIAALAMVGTLPGRTQGLGLITEPLLRDLGVSRVSFATVNLWATLVGALFCLPCGRLLDRFGSRLVLTTVIAALGLTVLTMSWTTGLVALSITITLSRGFGQSALSVVSLAFVGKWFGKSLNYAMAIYSVLIGIGFIAAFPGVGHAAVVFGWRPAWSGVGWFLLLLAAPACWLLSRDGPDDPQIEFASNLQQAQDAGADLSLGDACRGPAFWVFALSSAMFGLIYSGISLFNQSILEQRGFGASTFHTVLALSTFLGLVANFGGGWLAMRWSIQRLMAIGMAVLSLALLALPLVRTFAHVLAYGATMGIAGGIVTVVFFSVWGQIYGRGHLGRIQGAAQTMTVIASAIGPLILAETLARTGSYDIMFYSLAAITALFGVACWMVRLPQRPS